MTTELTLAVMTGATCGYACWLAEQDTCRCSCYGKNHGIMLTDGAEQPRRQCKIDGDRFALAVIGNERSLSYESLIREFEESEQAEPFLRSPFPNSNYRTIPGNSKWQRCLWWAKTATKSQMKWDEAQAFANPERPWDKPRILWVHESMIEAFDTWQASRESNI